MQSNRPSIASSRLRDANAYAKFSEQQVEHAYVAQVDTDAACAPHKPEEGISKVKVNNGCIPRCEPQTRFINPFDRSLHASRISLHLEPEKRCDRMSKKLWRAWGSRPLDGFHKIYV